MVPDTLGPYRVGHRLGKGGMGEVYLATDSRLGRQVAIKTILSNAASAPEHLRHALLREARAAAGLSHPSIATIYDVLEQGDEIFLVMEYVPGETLATRIARGRIPAQHTIRFAAQIADALVCAHESGIYHCDLKPGNIIVTPRGTAKILDFGLARTVTAVRDGALANSGVVETHTVRGTLPYMAPEVLGGRPADARSDIYSLGVTMYEMCSGERPFQAHDLLGLAAEVIAQSPHRLSEHCPDVSPELDAVVACAMAVEPDTRYQSATELGEVLKRLIVAEGDIETRTTAVAPRRHPGHSSRAGRPRLVAGGLATALIAIVIGLVGTVGRQESTSALAAVPVIAIVLQASATNGPGALAAGFADVLTDRLSSLPGLVVAAPVAAESAAGGLDLRQVARSRGASHLIVPTATAQAGVVSLRLELRAAEPDQLLWSRTLSGPVSDVFVLQRQLSSAAIAALRRRHLLSAVPPAKVAAHDQITSNVEAYADYAQGRTFESRQDVPGNLQRAVTLFERALARDSNFAQAHAALGRVSLRLYDQHQGTEWIDRARLEMLEALRLDPDSPTTRYSLAALYAETGQTGIAREELQRVIAQDPENDDAHRLLGRLEADAGDLDAALPHLEAARRLRPEYWENHRALGLAYFFAGRFPEAVAAFQRLTELQPDSAWGYQTLGTAYHAAGDRLRALENYTKAIAIAPSAKSYSNMGTLLYEERRYGEAVDAYDKALAIQPAAPMTHRNRGDALLRLNQKAAAAASYGHCVELSRQAIGVNRADADDLALLAYCEVRLGRRDAALTHIARAAAVAPEDNEVLFERAVVFTLVDRPCDALASLARAIGTGYSVALAARDDDLSALTGHPDYVRLTGVDGPKGRWADVRCPR